MVPAAIAGATSGRNCKVQLLRPKAPAAADNDEIALLRAAAHAEEAARSLRWASAA